MQFEQRRFFLLIAIGLIVVMLWHNWSAYTVAHQKTPSKNHTSQYTDISPSETQILAAQGANTDTTPVNQSNPLATKNFGPIQKIDVRTDLLHIKIDPIGGNIVYASLLKYPEKQGEAAPVVLLNNKLNTKYQASFSWHSPYTGTTAKLHFLSDQTHYVLDPKNGNLRVVLAAQDANHVLYKRTFIFKKEDYAVQIINEIHNQGQIPWQGRLYSQLTRANTPPEVSGLFHIAAYFGASYSSDEKAYQKLSFKKMQSNPLDVSTDGGWIAMQQHYFLSAIIPPKTAKNHLYSHVSTQNNLYTIGSASPTFTVLPDKSNQQSSVFYVGPELPAVLKTLAPHLDLTIDYGFLWFIAVIIFWCMQKIHAVVGNWGWSIVLVTILIKTAFYHLSATSYRSMAKMRVLQPKIKALQERCGDDKQQFTKETMDLYRKEKVNPLSGCLPIVIQIPVFIALYWVLIESVALRQAPFIFWITDLSVKDPFYVLPILNGLAMFFQQKLNPPPSDPTQAKMMVFMPVFLTLLFLNFPAGLVLYWLVNSVYSIAQQWWIMRNVEKNITSTKKTYYSRKNRKNKK